MRIVLAIAQALIVTGMIAGITEQGDTRRLWAVTLLLSSSLALYLGATGDEPSSRTYLIVSLLALNGMANASRRSEGSL